MKKTLKLTDQQALDLYKTSNNEWKKILEDNYGKDFFKSKEVTDIVFDEESLAEYLNLEDIDDLFIFDKNTKDVHERYINACNILPKVSKIYNEGIVLDWKNTSIYKWLPYLNFARGSWVACFSYWLGALYAPAGFYLKNENLARKHYTNFKKYWEDYWGYKAS